MMAQGRVTQQVALEALGKLEVDPLGLDGIDHRLLRSIIEKFGGGPVGLETLAASISEEADTIMDIYEPYLLQLGFLERTPRGRTATASAYRHLGIEPLGRDEPPPGPYALGTLRGGCTRPPPAKASRCLYLGQSLQ